MMYALLKVLLTMFCTRLCSKLMHPMICKFSSYGLSDKKFNLHLPNFSRFLTDNGDTCNVKVGIYFMLSDHVPKVHCLFRLIVAEPLEEKGLF